MKHRKLWILVVGLVSLAIPGLAPAQGSPEAGWSVADYVRLAWEGHPGLDAARARLEGSLARARGAGSWPDPVLDYAWFAREIETALGPQQHRVGLMQPVPWPGKTGLRREAARREAAVQNWNWQQRALEVQEDVIVALADYALLARQLEVEEAVTELLGDQEELARTRYRNSDSEQGELLRLQVERGRALDRLRRLRAARPAHAASLNAALGRAHHAPLPWPVELDPVGPPALLDGTPADSLLARLQERSPRLRALEQEATARAVDAKLARREQWPDIGVGVSTTFVGDDAIMPNPDAGRDAWMAMVQLRLPLWRGKYDALVGQAEAERRRVRAERRATALELRAGVERALFEEWDARTRLDFYRDELVPREREALRATATAWQNGRSDLLSFLDSTRSLLALELEDARALRDLYTANARLARLLGEALAPMPSPQEFTRP